MSRPRTMGAGLAGSMTKGVNVNQVQIGDKLQGLAPQATHFFVAGNGRAGWNQYRTRSNGNKRKFVFCMNQLGGVGAAKSQFKIRGLNKPDGTRKCEEKKYDGGLDSSRSEKDPYADLRCVKGTTANSKKEYTIDFSSYKREGEFSCPLLIGSLTNNPEAVEVHAGRCHREGKYLKSLFDYVSDYPQSFYHPDHDSYIPYDSERKHDVHYAFHDNGFTVHGCGCHPSEARACTAGEGGNGGP